MEKWECGCYGCLVCSVRVQVSVGVRCEWKSGNVVVKYVSCVVPGPR